MLARELFAIERLSVAGIGADEEAFRGALRPLGEDIAGAAAVPVASGAEPV